MIERTGFGKSLCYQFPATLFEGLTVVFSPLIALMRDQVKAMERLGIPAACINSGQTTEENDAVLESAMQNRLKLLYITPERQNSGVWTEAAMQSLNISMVVVDEAHTISVWGHDFRPAFQKIVNLVNILPVSYPVLAVTATATTRVQKDIQAQITGNLSLVRGNLVRENFRLRVVTVSSEEGKMVFLRNYLKTATGTGIVYAGTRAQAETYAKWLSFNNISCAHYHAGLDSDSRKEIESGLMSNKWKCVISTNALGMGIDKPDIRFVIHLQVPASPVHYYQEIGRAGRDGLPTDAILLYNNTVNADGIEKDLDLPTAFIETARPKVSMYQKVIDIIKSEPLGEREICRRGNVKQSEFRTIKEDLKKQKIIFEVKPGGKTCYEYAYDAPELDVSEFEAVRCHKYEDLRSMRDYIYTTIPRMMFLCSYLGDEERASCGHCDNTDLPKSRVELNDGDLESLADFREQTFVDLSVSLFPKKEFCGVAASYYGVSTVGESIHRCKYQNGGFFPDFLLTLTLKAYHKTFHGEQFDLIMYVPPTKSGDLVENFAGRIGKCLHIPVLLDGLQKTRETDEQKMFRNAVGKKANVDGAFSIPEDIADSLAGKRILLVDDIYDSGYTIKEICKLLDQNGAADIAFLVIAKTVGNDLD